MRKQLLLLFVLVALPITLWAENVEAEPYAVLSSDKLTVTFYYDENKLSREGIDIGYNIDNQQSPYATAATVIFDDSFANYKPYSMSSWFKGCSNLNYINGFSNLNTLFLMGKSRSLEQRDSKEYIKIF